MNQEEFELELKKLDKIVKAIYGKKGYLHHTSWSDKSHTISIVGDHYVIFYGKPFLSKKEAIDDCRANIFRLLKENASIIDGLASEINELQSRIDELIKLLLLI